MRLTESAAHAYRSRRTKKPETTRCEWLTETARTVQFAERPLLVDRRLYGRVRDVRTILRELWRAIW